MNVCVSLMCVCFYVCMFACIHACKSDVCTCVPVSMYVLCMYVYGKC